MNRVAEIGHSKEGYLFRHNFRKLFMTFAEPEENAFLRKTGVKSAK